MAFTYDLANADPLLVEIAQCRFELGDTTAGRGPRADGTNFSDAELTFVLNRLGVLGDADRPMRAVAALCETLARDWSKVASISVGPRSQQFAAVAEAWSKRAAALQIIYGGSTFAFSAALNRIDGYSDNAGGAGYE